MDETEVGPATATFYRHAFDLPFINGNDSRMVPNTFEAYQIDLRHLEFLGFNAGYVARIKTRKSTNFVSMSEAAGLLVGSADRMYLGAIVPTPAKIPMVEPPHQTLLIDSFRWRFFAVECLTGLGQNAPIFIRTRVKLATSRSRSVG